MCECLTVISRAGGSDNPILCGGMGYGPSIGLLPNILQYFHNPVKNYDNLVKAVWWNMNENRENIHMARKRNEMLLRRAFDFIWNFFQANFSQNPA